MSTRRVAGPAALLGAITSVCLLCLGGCGYHVAGSASHLPAGIHTIAVPAFENRSTTYRIEQRLTDAVVHELLARTKYQVAAKGSAGDAVLHGSVLTITSAPVIFDNVTGRATAVLVTVTLSVRLEETATGNILYRNDNIVFREPYEISTDVSSFFEEEGPALDRMAHDFAARVVAELVENF